MMRHIIEDEEFKRRQKIREERAARIAREEEQAAAEIEAKKIAQAVINPKPVNMRGKRLDDMTYHELVDQKPCDVVDDASERKRPASPPEKEMVQKKLKFD